MDPSNLTDPQKTAIQLVTVITEDYKHRLAAFMHDGREKSIALTKADEARLWAIESIANG